MKTPEGKIAMRWVILAGAIILMSAGTASQAANQCIVCHQSTETLQALPEQSRDSFLHWYGSIHGEKGVTCDSCHGGDPTEKSKVSAHTGIAKPSDPASKVYYKNLPDTCGACHQPIANAFKESVHYQLLKADQLAPTCTTCHGFYMDIQQVRPTAIIMRCQFCHVAGGKADSTVLKVVNRAFILREQTQADLQEGSASVKLLKSTHRKYAQTARRVEEAKAKFRETAIVWHSMKLKRFEKAVEEAKDLAESSLKMAQGELLKGRRPAVSPMPEKEKKP